MPTADDDDFPELTEADFARARRWRPGDPTPTLDASATATQRLRAMAEMLRAQARALEAEADALEGLG